VLTITSGVPPLGLPAAVGTFAPAASASAFPIATTEAGGLVVLLHVPSRLEAVIQ
jgi:hypothetical protein